MPKQLSINYVISPMHLYVISPMQLRTLAEGRSPLCVQAPQNGRFMTTPWTVDVDPRSPLPDYPRPQLQRQQWLNLNGIWQFQAGGWVPAVFNCSTASRAWSVGVMQLLCLIGCSILYVGIRQLEAGRVASSD